MEIKPGQAPAKSELVSINSKKAGPVSGPEPGDVRKSSETEKGRDYDVSLSPQAKKRMEESQKAFDIAKNTSPVREDKVRLIKEQIAAGTYKMDPGDIADGILREAVREHLALSE